MISEIPAERFAPALPLSAPDPERLGEVKASAGQLTHGMVLSLRLLELPNL